MTRLFETQLLLPTRHAMKFEKATARATGWQHEVTRGGCWPISLWWPSAVRLSQSCWPRLRSSRSWEPDSVCPRQFDCSSRYWRPDWETAPLEIGYQGPVETGCRLCIDSDIEYRGLRIAFSAGRSHSSPGNLVEGQPLGSPCSNRPRLVAVRLLPERRRRIKVGRRMSRRTKIDPWTWLV